MKALKPREKFLPVDKIGVIGEPAKNQSGVRILFGKDDYLDIDVTSGSGVTLTPSRGTVVAHANTENDGALNVMIVA